MAGLLTNRGSRCNLKPGRTTSKELTLKTLVTGSSGFIASYLIPELAGMGAEVVGIDLAAPPAALEGKAKLHRGDLSSPRDLYRVVASERPTHVIHLASLLAGPCEEDPSRGFDVNFGSTLTLLDASAAVGASAFVLASSISVFGQGLSEPVPDDAVKEPVTIYGKTKLASEQVLDWYRKKRGIRGIALRFPWVFGPGRERGITALYSSKLLDAVARGQKLVVDNPDECGDWLYVKDAVRAILLGLGAERNAHTAYNIMGGLHSIREVLAIAKELVPTADITFPGAGAGTSRSPYPAAFDDSRARRELGWLPRYSIRDAVRDHLGAVSGRRSG
jgi:UDP-glucose 4-epimerase